ncbi:MAG TPA: hypothetical protein VM933_08575 [Acidimicrobiales bacterium]|nr:hypothetical protein [Acidimicrobiales bacterium]
MVNVLAGVGGGRIVMHAILRTVLRGGRPAIPGLAVVSVALVVAAVAAGLRLPGVRFLDPFPDVGRLDYSAGPPGGFPPLDPRFVRDLLGTSEEAEGRTAREPAFQSAGPAGVEPPFPRKASLDDPSGPTLGAPVEVTHVFDNDDFARAYPISSVPFTARTNTAGASAERGEQQCGPLSGRSAWYAFTPQVDIGLLADTFGTDVAISLAVYTGTDLVDLERVPDTECSSDPRGNAQIAFPAKAQTTYYFQIDGPVAGDLVFTLQQQGATKRASISSSGQQSDGLSLFGVIARDGSQAVLASGASTFDEPGAPGQCVRQANIVAPCGRIAMYLRDGIRRRTTNLFPEQSVLVAGSDKGSIAFPGSMSSDGRYLAFWATVDVSSPGGSTARASSPYRFEVFRHDNVTGRNERVSLPCPQRTVCGTDTDASSARAEISADGRYVAFVSWAENIVADDRNGVRDVFVRDMVTQTTTRVDVPSDDDRDLGEPNDDPSTERDRPHESGDRGADLFSLSGDGRYVVFKSASSNLVRNDGNGVSDVFLRDRLARTTVRVNVSTEGREADHQTKSVLGVGLHTVSDDGRYVFFNSHASNLVSPPTADYRENLYRRDLKEGVTTLVTVSSRGTRADRGVEQDPNRAAFSYLAPLLVAGGTDVGLSGLSYSSTPDGRHAVFNSDATNLVPGDHNAATDIFLRDTTTGTTTRVSVSSTGAEAQSGKSCGSPTISDDARFVVFDCSAENLVEGDTNGIADIFVRELARSRPLTGWY